MEASHFPVTFVGKVAAITIFFTEPGWALNIKIKGTSCVWYSLGGICLRSEHEDEQRFWVKVLDQLLQFHLGWVLGCLVGYLPPVSDLAPSWLCLPSPTCRGGKKGGSRGQSLMVGAKREPVNQHSRQWPDYKHRDGKQDKTVHFQQTKTTPSLHRRVWQPLRIVSEFCSTLIPTQEWGLLCANQCPACLMRATACLRNVRLNAIGEEEKPCWAGRKKDRRKSSKAKFKAKEVPEVLKGNWEVFLREMSFEEEFKRSSWWSCTYLGGRNSSAKPLGRRLSCKLCLFIQIHVFRNKRQFYVSSFVLLTFPAGIRQAFSIHSSKAKNPNWYSKSLVTYKNTGVCLVGRDPSEKRIHSLLLLGLFQHPS